MALKYNELKWKKNIFLTWTQTKDDIFVSSLVQMSIKKKKVLCYFEIWILY